MMLSWTNNAALPPDAALPDDEERRLLEAVGKYLPGRDIAHVKRAIACLEEADTRRIVSDLEPARARERAFAVAVTLAEVLHLDAVTIAAELLYPLVERHAARTADLRARLGGAFGEQVAHTIESIERFDSLQRPATALRRSAQAGAEGDDAARDRRRGRERQREQDADALRRMFVAMAEDPRVVVIKIADQLRLMRAVREAADIWRLRASEPATVDADRIAAEPHWSLAECRMYAGETREVFAPLAGRLGMAHVESELEDLAFAVLEPDEYRWLSDAVARESLERGEYVERVCAMLREEMARIGITAEVSGRIKHLYSIYKKVQRTGTRDLAALYDILAFRIIVSTIEECYLVLGHVHDLWRPKDGRIKDFIASPKSNGYQSLHTTVFCLDDRLAEIQIRTHAMHELAEYGVAMHWYYKDVGDAARARAKPLQSWVQQVKEWQQEIAGGDTTPTAAGDFGGVPSESSREQIYVFTPAGDAKELPPARHHSISPTACIPISATTFQGCASPPTTARAAW